MTRLIISAIIAVAVFTAVKRHRGEPLPPVLSNVQKCIQYYELDKAEMSQNEEVVKTMIQYGFRTVDDLILESCIIQNNNGTVY